MNCGPTAPVEQHPHREVAEEGCAEQAYDVERAPSPTPPALLTELVTRLAVAWEQVSPRS